MVLLYSQFLYRYFFELKTILDYFLSTIYLIYFGLVLCIFHVIQIVAYRFFGQNAHQQTVHWLNCCLVYGFRLTGSTTSFYQKTKLNSGQSYIFVANHRSMFDIPGMVWYLRKYVPLFVSKIELAKGIPSISYNLRVGNAALIDRNDHKQAIAEIARLGTYICKHKQSAAIFPEGTRAKTDQLKPFAIGGLAILMKKCPNAKVVPVAITNTGHFNPKGIFPLKSFTKMTWNTLTPIDRNGLTPEEVCQNAHQQIKEFLGQ